MLVFGRSNTAVNGEDGLGTNLLLVYLVYDGGGILPEAILLVDRPGQPRSFFLPFSGLPAAVFNHKYGRDLVQTVEGGGFSQASATRYCSMATLAPRLHLLLVCHINHMTNR